LSRLKEQHARALTLAALFGVSAAVYAAGADLGQAVSRRPTGPRSSMFAIFVVFTLSIHQSDLASVTKTKSTADFYTAGGGITGFQNGLAIAGDYMSAARRSSAFSRGGDGVRASTADLLESAFSSAGRHHLPDGRASSQPGPVHLRPTSPRSASSRRPVRIFGGVGHASA